MAIFRIAHWEGLLGHGLEVFIVNGMRKLSQKGG
jgi:hypothetical protein